jgi:exosortase/archaeosortase family protein
LKAGIRFLIWAGTGSVLAVGTATNFPGLLTQSLGESFGGEFSAIPFVALLVLIFGLRWRELADVLASEEGWRTRLSTRIVGASMIILLLAARNATGQNVAASGVALILTFYGASLAINPMAARFMLPYAAVFASGVTAPSVLQWAFGEPLATLSSGLSAGMAGFARLPVTWQGTQFLLLSKSGGSISGVITPDCSSVVSVTLFLGLLALMHLDMKKDVRSTAKLAAAGVAALTLLNSVRILILFLVGYEFGGNAFWGVHEWLGYAIFLGFYLTVLPVYFRMGGPPDKTAALARPLVPV